jgi:drug/metabolite transporter (DMT)-like permease
MPAPQAALKSLLRGFDWRVAVALAATYLLFGSGPAAVAAAIKTMPPFMMVASRGLIAGLILTGWAILEGERPTWREWRGSALIGLLILAGGAGAGTYGQLTVPSGVAGVLSALLPLIAAMMGYCFFGEKLPPRGTIGLIVGFAGIALLLRPGSGLDLFGVAVIVGGQVAWAAGAELAPRVGLPEEPRLAAGLELLSGGAALFAFSMVFGDLGRISFGAISAVSWIGFIWFIVIAIGGFTAFGYLSQTIAPSIATTFSYVNPVVAMTMGWLLFSEPVSWRMVIAVAVIVTGVCLIVSTKSDAPAKTRHPMTSGYGNRRAALQGASD